MFFFFSFLSVFSLIEGYDEIFGYKIVPEENLFCCCGMILNNRLEIAIPENQIFNFAVLNSTTGNLIDPNYPDILFRRPFEYGQFGKLPICTNGYNTQKITLKCYRRGDISLYEDVDHLCYECNSESNMGETLNTGVNNLDSNVNTISSNIKDMSLLIDDIHEYIEIIIIVTVIILILACTLIIFCIIYRNRKDSLERIEKIHSHDQNSAYATMHRPV